MGRLVAESHTDQEDYGRWGEEAQQALASPALAVRRWAESSSQREEWSCRTAEPCMNIGEQKALSGSVGLGGYYEHRRKGTAAPDPG